MTSDTSLIQLLIQYGIGPTMVIALMITGWLVTKRHLDDTAGWGEGWRQECERERAAHQRTRDENQRVIGEMTATLAGVGATLDRVLYRLGYDDERGQR